MRGVPGEVVAERGGGAEHGEQPVPRRAAGRRTAAAGPARPRRPGAASSSRTRPAQREVGVGDGAQRCEQAVGEDVLEGVDAGRQRRVGEQPGGALGVGEAEPREPPGGGLDSPRSVIRPAGLSVTRPRW